MARQRRAGVRAWVVAVVVAGGTATALARQEPGKSGLEPAQPGDEAKAQDAGMIDLLGTGSEAPDPDLVAGLRREARAPVLTLRRAYQLALIRHRAPTPPGKGDRPNALDPKALDALGRRFGVGDFARFRKDLHDRQGPSLDFHDPAAEFLGLVVTLQGVESARRRVVGGEQFLRYDESMLAVNIGVTRLQVDRDRLDLERRRDLLGDALRRHREAVDDFKVAIGLPPDSPLVVDRSALAPFADAFDEATLWLRGPDRDPRVLAAILLRPPALPDVIIEGRSLATLVRRDPDARDPGGLEEWLQAVSRADRLGWPERSLRLRRLARRLHDLRRASESDRKKYEMAIRMEHRILERIFAPPREGAGPEELNVVLSVHDLIRARDDASEFEDRIVSDWAAYQADRLALLRELGIGVGRDWESYIAAILPPVAPRVLKPAAERPADLPEPPPLPPPPDPRSGRPFDRPREGG